MMGQEVNIVLNHAIRKANLLRHEYLSLEILLWAMLRDKNVSSLLEETGVIVLELEKELEEHLLNSSSYSVITKEKVDELQKAHFLDEKIRQMAQAEGIYYQPELSVAMQRTIQRAAHQIQSSGKKEVRPIHLLLALMLEEESFAVYLILKRGVDRFKLVELVAHRDDRPINDAQNGATINEGPKKSALLSFTVNLTEKFKEISDFFVIGRDKELLRIAQILSRRSKNNLIVIGDSGVGKTHLIESFIWQLAKNKVHELFKDVTVYSLDVAALIAGARFRGDFEERFKVLISELLDRHKAGPTPILFIDDFHQVVQNGPNQQGAMDIAQLLRPIMSKNLIRVIGATNHEQYRKNLEKEESFIRLFQKIDLPEMSVSDSILVLHHVKKSVEEHYKIKFEPDSVEMACKLSFRYIRGRALPDKAIDVLDEVGAKHLINSSNSSNRVFIEDVEKVIAVMAGLPQESVTNSESKKLESLKEFLQRHIFGQDQAINQLTDAVLLSRSGLKNPNHPMGAFLFTGPTGVGKTELAKQLALGLGIQLVRFDMSEYMEKHTVAKFIGAPPGYVGHDGGGLLTDMIKKHPYSVLLLDEIEKAHPDIYNLLLQVMDHGTLTDSHGRFTDFRNVCLIMTTNTGARELEMLSIGVNKAENSNMDKLHKEIRRFFTPEFRNRLDSVIYFQKLSFKEIELVVLKFVEELKQRLNEQGIELIVEKSAIDQIAKIGFEPSMGARPIERLIDQKVKNFISKEIVFGRLKKGSSVIVRFVGSDFQFEFI